MGILITSWKWFAQKCFFELKQQLIAVSSHKKLEKGTVQPTIHSTAEPPSLAEVEFHPILLRVYHISCPHTQHQAGFWWGKWRDKLKVCEWGGDELPSHLEEFVALFCPLPPSHTKVHFSISQSHSMHVAIGTLMQCMSLCLCVSMCTCACVWCVHVCV